MSEPYRISISLKAASSLRIVFCMYLLHITLFTNEHMRLFVLGVLNCVYCYGFIVYNKQVGSLKTVRTSSV